ncbi:glycosyltransferase [Mumia zhuanghuii]|uniref:Glycosyltransferase n=1 Tax=Mumia zhuanghuii TaxID=2585211 RepID=A0A5C4MWG6_9ACTN|nr:glycosyltransferase [Mumia zhuanghuii]TNC33348.1 glycosyltransferase [Mumia zhuanghuii]TNC48916.1 glycosyltransferase [Mumia zhuanghuii]
MHPPRPRPRPPDGTYLSFASALRLDKGGRTAVMLMRARMLAEHPGVRSVIATVGDVPDLARTHDVLRGRGALTEDVAVTNIYDDYATREVAAVDSGADMLALLDLVATPDNRDDGTPYRISYRQPDVAPGAEPEVVDYLRADGTVAVRRHLSPQRFELVDRDGRVVRRHKSRTSFVQQWLRELVGPDDGFVIADSRRTLPLLFGLSGSGMHVVATFHNPHTAGDARWDSPLKGPYVKVLERLHDLDGLVLLTERHKDEIALRAGATANLFVVPNAVEPPELPDPPPPRDRTRLVTVARLEGQKRVSHSLRALEIARRTDPTLRLDVYGDGSSRGLLEATARDLELDGAVTFHGYDPRARDAISTAAAFLLTSNHEGYPLATLEAMSRGCPVISYDVRFGPREQIDDGVDGYLVPSGDVETFAARILDLTSDPDRIARMSAAACMKASEHSPRRFADDWAEVFRQVRAQAGSRVTLQRTRLHGVRLGRQRFAARLRTAATGHGASDVDALTATLDVVGETTGEVVQVPVNVGRPLVSPRADGFRITAPVDHATVATTLGAQPVRVRLNVVWHNACWMADVARGHATEDGLSLERLS